MKRITWIAISLALAVTASLVVAKTWSERLERQHLAHAGSPVQAPSPDGLMAPSADYDAQSNWPQSQVGPLPQPVANPQTAAQLAPPPQPPARGGTPAVWTVKVVRGQNVDEIHYRTPYVRGNVE